MEKKKRILVVDDDRIVRKIIREELEQIGYDVVEAEDGVDALSIVSTETPVDLITLDIAMPGLDGFETCQKLYDKEYSYFFSDHKDGMVPIVFITSNDTLEDRKKGFDLGAMDFISKPFAKGEIGEKINSILRPDESMRGLTALVVDDHDTSRTIVSKILKEKGIRIHEAEDGIKGFRIMTDLMENIDLLITDFLMPEMDGRAFCMKVRKELGLQDLPIIFLTAVKDQAGLLSLFKAGGTDYIVKPFVKEELLGRIDVHLKQAKLTQRLRSTIQSLTAANEEIKYLSITDPLTQCFNRGYLIDQLTREISRARRYERRLSIIMCDIDHFKNINDTHGHLAGDEVLKQIVRIIAGGIRQNVDWVARYGGEEFVIVLPEIGLKGTEILAERLRKTISEKEISIKNSKIKVTISFGGTTISPGMPSHLYHIEKMLSISDQLLYRSKMQGRNKVTVRRMETWGTSI